MRNPPRLKILSTILSTILLCGPLHAKHSDRGTSQFVRFFSGNTRQTETEKDAELLKKSILDIRFSKAQLEKEYPYLLALKVDGIEQHLETIKEQRLQILQDESKQRSLTVALDAIKNTIDNTRPQQESTFTLPKPLVQGTPILAGCLGGVIGHFVYRLLSFKKIKKYRSGLLAKESDTPDDDTPDITSLRKKTSLKKWIGVAIDGLCIAGLCAAGYFITRSYLVQKAAAPSKPQIAPELLQRRKELQAQIGDLTTKLTEERETNSKFMSDLKIPPGEGNSLEVVTAYAGQVKNLDKLENVKKNRSKSSITQFLENLAPQEKESTQPNSV